MSATQAFHEPLANLLAAEPTRAATRLPTSLPLGFPHAFRDRLSQLAQDRTIADETLDRLYFDLVLCPQLHASIRRMQADNLGASDQPASEAIFLDAAFSWQRHLDDRLNQRWRERLLRQNQAVWADQSLALLSSFRVLAEHLH